MWLFVGIERADKNDRRIKRVWLFFSVKGEIISERLFLPTLKWVKEKRRGA